jgi:N-acetylmuramoyl-L-alanine amidase
MLAVPVREPLASTVEFAGNRLSWILYGGKVTSARPATARRGVVERAVIKDRRDGRIEVTVSLRDPPLGWRVRWDGAGATLEIRPLPKPSIKGMVVVLDPGHPPEGTTGPTGLREDSVTLAVARSAEVKLRALGARVVLTRADSNQVSLEARTATAESANATVLVSIHVNAPAEGQPPGSADGTRVFWFQPTSPPLARALRDSVATALGQSRAGTPESNLAVLRSTWFPSVLIEATALPLPIREAALRSPRGIDAYAEGIAAGLRAWAATLH